MPQCKPYEERWREVHCSISVVTIWPAANPDMKSSMCKGLPIRMSQSQVCGGGRSGRHIHTTWAAQFKEVKCKISTAAQCIRILTSSSWVGKAELVHSLISVKRHRENLDASWCIANCFLHILRITNKNLILSSQPAWSSFTLPTAVCMLLWSLQPLTLMKTSQNIEKK